MSQITLQETSRGSSLRDLIHYEINIYSGSDSSGKINIAQRIDLYKNIEAELQLLEIKFCEFYWSKR